MLDGGQGSCKFKLIEMVKCHLDRDRMRWENWLADDRISTY